MKRLRRITFWWLAFAAIAAAGICATALRVFGGLGASTGLSDSFAWGIWIGFDVLCGVGLAAGGFTVAGMVYVFRLDHYRPILRATVLTAFLGYIMVTVSLLYDLGLPYRIWHPMVMGNMHSPMFELAVCVMFYTTVLFLEFVPVVFERLGMKTPVRLLHTIILPLVILGVLLSTLHQSTLGTLYVIAPNKLHGLWYSPLLPVFFFVSAIGAGLSMTILESFLSHRAFGTRLHRDVLVGLGRAASRVMAVYLVLKIGDLLVRGKLGLLFEGSVQSWLFLLEVTFGVVLPGILFHLPAIRKSDAGLFYSALLLICGFVLNRMDVSITGMRGHEVYFPTRPEVAISVFIVACGFVVFGLAVRYLPVFPAEEEASPAPPALPVGEVGAEAATVVAASAHGIEYVPLMSGDHRLREPRRADLASPTSTGILIGLAAFLVLCALLARGNGEAPGPARAAMAARTTFAATAPAMPALDSARLPSPHVFPVGQASPGRVTFVHESHVMGASLACGRCHSRLFGLVTPAVLQTGGETIATMRHCGECHNGGAAFAVNQDCKLCHEGRGGASAPASATQRRPPAEYAFPRGSGSPGPVTFSHTRHMTASGATCSTCHPARFRMAPPNGAAAPNMAAARGGHQCGGCHNGREAFTVSSDCGLCHRRTESLPPTPVSTRQASGPPALLFPAGKGSPGRVAFRHDTHAGREGGKCSGCHPALFPMLAGISPVSMKQMHGGRQCGACHDGRKAFTVARDCGLCHQRQRRRSATPVSERQVAPPDEFGYPKGPGSPGSVRFSHSRHLRAAGGGSCTGCHPHPFPMARSKGLRMQEMRAGRQCGACHDGRTAFTAASDCMLCHRGRETAGGRRETDTPGPAVGARSSVLRPPSGAPAPAGHPADHVYARGSGSPGTVTFSHARHIATGGANCGTCHAGLLQMSKPTPENPGVTMASMYQGKECGHCHNGTAAFAAVRECGKCHVAGTQSARQE